MDTVTCSFDKAKTARLQRAYNQAVAAKQTQFTFEGHELLTGYAKYLLQFLKQHEFLL